MVAGAKEDLLTLRGRMESENCDELLGKLPAEVWSKIVDENVQQNDLLALAMTCRFFRDTTKELGKKVETNLGKKHLRKLQKTGNVPSHTLGWFQWVCDTMEIRPGFAWWDNSGAVYEGSLLHYAAFQGSVEILRWLMEEKGWKLTLETGEWAGMGGSIEVLEYLKGTGCEFNEYTCQGAAMGGHLEALKYLREAIAEMQRCGLTISTSSIGSTSKKRIRAISGSYDGATGNYKSFSHSSLLAAMRSQAV